MPNTLDRMAMIAETKKVKVNVHGMCGGAGELIGVCKSAMWRAGIEPKLVGAFQREAMSKDYTNALRTCDLWITLVDVAPSGSSGSLIGSLRRLGLAPEPQEELCWRGWD
jgi:hypothetical protein